MRVAQLSLFCGSETCTSKVIDANRNGCVLAQLKVKESRGAGLCIRLKSGSFFSGSATPTLSLGLDVPGHPDCRCCPFGFEPVRCKFEVKEATVKNNRKGLKRTTESKKSRNLHKPGISYSPGQHEMTVGSHSLQGPENSKESQGFGCLHSLKAQLNGRSRTIGELQRKKERPEHLELNAVLSLFSAKKKGTSEASKSSLKREGSSFAGNVEQGESKFQNEGIGGGTNIPSLALQQTRSADVSKLLGSGKDQGVRIVTDSQNPLTGQIIIEALNSAAKISKAKKSRRKSRTPVEDSANQENKRQLDDGQQPSVVVKCDWYSRIESLQKEIEELRRLAYR